MAEATLKDVIRELKTNRRSDDDTTGAVLELNNSLMTFITSLKQENERSRLQAEEDRREGGTARNGVDGTIKGGLSAQEEAKGPSLFSRMFSGSFLGTFLGRNALKWIITPLKLLFKLLRFGGPIGIALGLLYTVFKDIGENPNFTKALTAISSVWNDRIVPAWNSIAEKFSNLFKTEEFDVALKDISYYWDKISGWFTGTFVVAIQNFALDTGTIILDGIANTLEAIDKMMSGDFIGGMLDLGSALITGIMSSIDSLFTRVLEAFGADFGESGSFLNYGRDLAISFNKWANSKVNVIMDAMTGAFDYLIAGFNNIKDVISLTFTYVKTSLVNDFKTAFNSISKIFANIPDQLYLMIAKNLRFGMPQIDLPLPEWMQSMGAPPKFTLLNGFSVGVGDPGTIAQAQGRISLRATEDTNYATARRNETADALAELSRKLSTMNNAKNGNGGSTQLVIAPSNNNTSNVQSNTSNIMSFPSTVNPIGPQ